jgi:membrane protease YdiL (CAAX protease family)
VLLFFNLSRGDIQFTQSFLIFSGAVLFGVASALARERSESILASVLLHWVCAAVLLFSSHLLF